MIIKADTHLEGGRKCLCPQWEPKRREKDDEEEQRQEFDQGAGVCVYFMLIIQILV